MYNLTNLTNTENISGIILYANNSTSGVLFGGLMIAIFFIMLFGLKRWDFTDTILVSSFSCLLLSLILVSINLLSIYYSMVFLVILSFSGFWAYMNQN